MKVKPILFNTEMVCAILDNRKTVTRRIIKRLPPTTSYVHCTEEDFAWALWRDRDEHLLRAPYQPDDILYVRETWATHYTADDKGGLYTAIKQMGLI